VRYNNCSIKAVLKINSIIRNIILFVLLDASCFAQTYEEQINKCQANFQLDPQGEIEQQFNTQISLFRACVKGLTLPDFNAQDVYDRIYSKDDLYGKVTLITYCVVDGPCQRELPILNELLKNFEGTEFQILSFYADGKETTMEFVKPIKNQQIIFANGNDLIENKFKMLAGYPVKILLNKKVQVVDYLWGSNENTLADIKLKIKEELIK
jgi:thiol-disulfide isomerase/thioredoxin